MPTGTIVYNKFDHADVNVPLLIWKNDSSTGTTPTAVLTTSDTTDDCDRAILNNTQTLITFERTPNPFGFKGIGVCAPDGSGLATVFTGALGASANQPYWHPTSDLIVFTVGDGSIRRVAADGSGATTLQSGLAFTPAHAQYNYDGTKIAYVGGTTLYMINADGTGLTTLDAGGIGFNNPFSWAYSSNTIAYGNDQSGASANYYVMDADTATRTTVFTGNVNTINARVNIRGFAPDDSFFIGNGDFIDATVQAQLISVNTNGSGSAFLGYYTKTTNSGYIYGSRIYMKKWVSPSSTFISIALDGTDERTEDTDVNNVVIYEP